MGYAGPWGVEVLSEALRNLPIEEIFKRAYETTSAQCPRPVAPRRSEIVTDRRSTATGSIWMFTQMLRIREFEERVKRTFNEHPGVIRGHTHLADGAEASIVGSLAALRARRPGAGDLPLPRLPDRARHRHQGDDGRDLRPRATACARAYGGSMHLVDVERGFLGTSGIVGAGIPHAAGAA